MSEADKQDIRANPLDKMGKLSESSEKATYINLAEAAENMARAVSSNYRKLAKFMGSRARTVEVSKDGLKESRKGPIFSKLKEHRDSMFQSSVAGITDAIQKDEQRTALFGENDGKNQISFQSMLLRTTILKNYACSIVKTNPQEVIESEQSASRMVKFCQVMRSRVSDIAEAVLVSGRLYMQEAIDRTQKLAKFFAPEARTVGLGREWIRLHGKVAGSIIFGAGVATVGFSVFSGHLNAAEIQHGVANALDFINHTINMDTNSISEISSGAIQHMDPSIDMNHISVLTDKTLHAMNVPTPNASLHSWASGLGANNEGHEIIKASTSIPVHIASPDPIINVTDVTETPASKLTISPNHGTGMSIAPDATPTTTRAVTNTHPYMKSHTAHNHQYNRADQMLSDLRGGRKPGVSNVMSASDRLNEAQLSNPGNLAKASNSGVKHAIPEFTSTADKLNYEQLQIDRNPTMSDQVVNVNPVQPKNPAPNILPKQTPAATPYFTSKADELNYQQLNRASLPSTSSARDAIIPQANASLNKGDGWDIGRSVAKKMAQSKLPVTNDFPHAPVLDTPTAVPNDLGIAQVSRKPSVVDSSLLGKMQDFYKKR